MLAAGDNNRIAKIRHMTRDIHMALFCMPPDNNIRYQIPNVDQIRSEWPVNKSHKSMAKIYAIDAAIFENHNNAAIICVAKCACCARWSLCACAQPLHANFYNQQSALKILLGHKCIHNSMDRWMGLFRLLLSMAEANTTPSTETYVHISHDISDVTAPDPSCWKTKVTIRDAAINVLVV